MMQTVVVVVITADNERGGRRGGEWCVQGTLDGGDETRGRGEGVRRGGVY